MSITSIHQLLHLHQSLAFIRKKKTIDKILSMNERSYRNFNGIKIGREPAVNLQDKMVY